jgi:DNA-binding transcriptional ArsR family regulator
MATSKSRTPAVKAPKVGQMASKANRAPAAKSSALRKRKVSRAQPTTDALTDDDAVFNMAAETFRVMSAPMRLKIISSLCNQEKNVGQLLEEIDTTQPNMSQHLNTLFKAKILGRRRDGVQIYYRIINERVVTVCRAVCMQIAIDEVTI